MTAIPQLPENKMAEETRNRTKAAETGIELKITIRGVAMIKPMTVPVRINPDRSNSMMPIVAAVMNLTIWREGGFMLAEVVGGYAARNEGTLHVVAALHEIEVQNKEHLSSFTESSLKQPQYHDYN
ncbi:hypothetical protein CR513_42135, partial [Mucuna pruriens]